MEAVEDEDVVAAASSRTLRVFEMAAASSMAAPSSPRVQEHFPARNIVALVNEMNSQFQCGFLAVLLVCLSRSFS